MATPGVASRAVFCVVAICLKGDCVGDGGIDIDYIVHGRTTSGDVDIKWTIWTCSIGSQCDIPTLT